MITQHSISSASGAWPGLPVDNWTATRNTLHMWFQIVGKIRLAQAPMLNHWWQVPLYVTPRGLSTSPMPHGHNQLEIEFDFIDHQLNIQVSSGAQRQIKLAPKSVADFYGELMTTLKDLNLQVDIMARPVEIEDPIPFAQDTQNTSYDPDSVRKFWGQLLAADRVMNQFRSHFTGKTSPVHFFWGAMELAYTRFSGRTAPIHPGGVPNCPDWVMVEGYSHELSSCGFWPGGSAEGTFYAYAYPEPDGFSQTAVSPTRGYYSTDMGEFLLPYAEVRAASNPDAMLLDFLQTTYAAAADNAGWDREHLEDDPQRLSSHTS